MGTIRIPLPVKLFVGMLSADPSLFTECAGQLTGEFGAVDLTSEIVPWCTSDYYRDEMGYPLFRQFLFFHRLSDPSLLPSAKLFTNELEARFSIAAGAFRRRINIDPGYVTEAKVVLASTKDFSHRVYVGHGVYAEVTLRYNSRESSFAPLEHTYFDFRENTYRGLFNKARELLRRGLER